MLEIGQNCRVMCTNMVVMKMHLANNTSTRCLRLALERLAWQVTNFVTLYILVLLICMYIYNACIHTCLIDIRDKFVKQTLNLSNIAISPI